MLGLKDRLPVAGADCVPRCELLRVAAYLKQRRNVFMVRDTLYENTLCVLEHLP